MNITSTGPETSYDAPPDNRSDDTHDDIHNDIRGAALTRPTRNRMLTGVAAGFADYLGVDVTIVRVVLAVLTVVGGAAVPFYLAAWLLIPESGADQSLAMEFLRSHRAGSR